MNPKNPYETRWRWWYEAIADWMIANPGGRMSDCAAALNKHICTVSQIANTDLFRDYLANRKREWRERHDFSIIQKTTEVAELGLDVLLETLKTKRSAVPIGTLNEITSTALDRLGYGVPSAPLVQVNQIDNSRNVTIPVAASVLEEARMAIRQVEASRRRGLLSPMQKVERVNALESERPVVLEQSSETQQRGANEVRSSEANLDAPQLPFS